MEMKKLNIISDRLLFALLLSFAIVFSTGCDDTGKTTGSDNLGAPRGDESFGEVVKRRGLNSKDVLAAAKTFTPDNLADEYVALNSGGQEGNMIPDELLISSIRNPITINP